MRFAAGGARNGPMLLKRRFFFGAPGGMKLSVGGGGVVTAVASGGVVTVVGGVVGERTGALNALLTPLEKPCVGGGAVTAGVATAPLNVRT